MPLTTRQSCSFALIGNPDCGGRSMARCPHPVRNESPRVRTTYSLCNSLEGVRRSHC
jgi:hypothetical protein